MNLRFVPAATLRLCLLLSFVLVSDLCGEAPVRVQGVGALSKVMKAAAKPLREKGIEIKIGEECGNTQAIAALGTGEIDIALLARTLTGEERAAYPDREFHEYKIGAQTVAVMVSRAVWESGVRALKREQVMSLYEGKIRSWKELGGEDRAPKFFETVHGQGVWEIFATWLYGDMRKAPAVPWEGVETGAEVQTALQFNSGGIAIASLRWADRRDVFPLSIVDDSGEVVEPTFENVFVGKYPLSRPAYLVVGNKPATARRKVVEFMESAEGQEIVRNQDLLPIKAANQP